jgi:hypothetical protein
MGLLPEKINYIARAATLLGHIQPGQIQQVGESISSVQTPFTVLDTFAHLKARV